MAALNVAGIEFVTTPQVLLECANAAARKQYRNEVYRLRDRMLREQTVVDVADSDVDQAWREYHLGAAGSASVVDHISFIIMRRLGITDAFTNDRHFKTAGFNTLF